MTTQLSQERAAALAALPSGFSLVEGGSIEASDLVWDFCQGRWAPVAVAQPMGPGQKRPGLRQQSEVGRSVQQYVAVARPCA